MLEFLVIFATTFSHIRCIVVHNITTEARSSHFFVWLERIGTAVMLPYLVCFGSVAVDRLVMATHTRWIQQRRVITLSRKPPAQSVQSVIPALRTWCSSPALIFFTCLPKYFIEIKWKLERVILFFLKKEVAEFFEYYVSIINLCIITVDKIQMLVRLK